MTALREAITVIFLVCVVFAADEARRMFLEWLRAS